MSQIMISYNRKNEDIIKTLAQNLEDQGHTVWFDQNVSGGQAWWNQILSHVRKCDFFIFALSPASVESEACSRECQYATDLGKPILPILVADSVSINLLPPALSKIQFVDYRKQDIGTVNRLARAVNNMPHPKPLPDPLPEPPPVPISYLGNLYERIGSRTELSFEEQCTLLVELKSALRDFEDKNDVYNLFKKFRKRHDLRDTIGWQIDELLSDSPLKVPHEVKNGGNKSEDLPRVPHEVKNGGNKSEDLPKVPDEVKNVGSKSDDLPKVPHEVKNGRNKSEDLPKVPHEARNGRNKSEEHIITRKDRLKGALWLGLAGLVYGILYHIIHNGL